MLTAFTGITWPAWRKLVASWAGSTLILTEFKIPGVRALWPFKGRVTSMKQYV